MESDARKSDWSHLESSIKVGLVELSKPNLFGHTYNVVHASFKLIVEDCFLHRIFLARRIM